MQETTQAKKTDYTVNGNLAIVLSTVIMLPLIICIILIYQKIWLNNGMSMYDISPIPSYVLMFLWIIGFVVHEAIHGVTAAVYARNKFRSLRFGVVWKYLTPYCHCTDPLRVEQYRTVAIMPLIVLGLLPCAIAMIIHSNVMMLFSLVLIFGSGGDVMIILLSLKVPPRSWIKDHDSKIGFMIIENE